jgi:outer membrane receptor for ferrienterochelin and colicins
MNDILRLLWTTSLLFTSIFLGAQNSYEITVRGACEMCKERIEAAAAQVYGVEQANYDLEKELLIVTSDLEAFDPQQVHWAVTAAGHDTDEWKANTEIYNSLPACCYYRSEAIEEMTYQFPDVNEAVTVKGKVFEQNEKGEKIPLIGVSIYWLGTDIGAVSDENGLFELGKVNTTDMLVTSYVGYANDTFDLTGKAEFELLLSEAYTLDGVEVVRRRRSTEISFLEPIKAQKIGEEELLKAACCNLSESFETNPAVDVSFTDAVTGTRQIEMLGLAGPNVQITRELIPDIRGLSAIYGFTYIPGPWVESIQLIKGPGSVISGFESMTGQINVELRKPEKGDKVYFNGYANEGGRYEGNLNLRHSLSEKWHTGLLLHAGTLTTKQDRNNDGFLDMPIGDEFIAVNRWRWTGENGWEGQFGFKGTYIDKQSGQTFFDPENDRNNPSVWGANIETKRLEAWMKTGKVFLNKPGHSVGFQMSGAYHDQISFFGQREYIADQTSFYSNLMYQGLMGTTTHQFTTGLTFQYDDYTETFDDLQFDREEIVPGAFIEYTYQPKNELTIVGGLRADHHNNFGLFVTPRLHFRYAFEEEKVFRLSAGRGQRTASILAENIGAMASNRQFVIRSVDPETPYGLNQEVSWNFGINWTQAIQMGAKDLLLSLDAYHTRFSQQIVVDYDASPQEIRFYNLDGKSYSNSLQAQVDMEIFPRFDIRIAYRFNDVQVDYDLGQLEKPLVAQHRSFLNLAYATTNDWKFDMTFNWQGSKRLPSTVSNPEEFRLADRSPDFLTTNAQVSKGWLEKYEAYLGVENLFNFRQEDPILDSANPFSDYFDSSMVWGPVFGRIVYVGVRLRI